MTASCSIMRPVNTSVHGVRLQEPVDADRPFLPLPVQSVACLPVVVERPGQAGPHDLMPPVLDVQPVFRGLRVGGQERDPPLPPLLQHALLVHLAHAREAGAHALQLVLELVEHEHGPVRRAYDVRERVEFHVVHVPDRPVRIVRVRVQASARQLGELHGEHARVGGGDGRPVAQFGDHLPAQPVVRVPGRFRHVEPMVGLDHGRQAGQPVGRLHAQAERFDEVQDLLLGAVAGPVVDGLPASSHVDVPGRGEPAVPVAGHGPFQRLGPVDDRDLAPQVQ